MLLSRGSHNSCVVFGECVTSDVSERVDRPQYVFHLIYVLYVIYSMYYFTITAIMCFVIVYVFSVLHWRGGS